MSKHKLNHTLYNKQKKKIAKKVIYIYIKKLSRKPVGHFD